MSRRRAAILTGALLLLMVAAVAGYFIFHIWLRFAAYKPPVVVSVEAYYPGADAQTVVDSVAAPIEEQVSGLEGLLSMSSQSAADGRYTLHVMFPPGSNTEIAQVLVENRVCLAWPALPAAVQREDYKVRVKAPEPLVLVSLTSPDNRFDTLYLSNYATTIFEDELARLPGVAEVVVFGKNDYRTFVWPDSDKLAAYQLSLMDVIAAIEAQNIPPAGRPLGAPVPKGQRLLSANSMPGGLIISTPGWLIELEQLESIIIKVSPEGGFIRLKDVARLEPCESKRADVSVSLNGQSAVLLSIHPLPNAKLRDVSRAVGDKLAEIRSYCPKGVALAVAFDFAPNLVEPNDSATPEHLVIDVQLPDSASAERKVKTLEQAAKLLRQTPGVQDVLTMTEHPFALVRNQPCIVVRLTPKGQRQLSREQIAGQVRVALQNQIPEAMFRLSLPATAKGFPVYGFPVEFTIEDRGGQGSAALQQCAEALVQKMNQSGKFSDAGVSSGLRDVPVVIMDIDRTKCQALDVEMKEILNALEVYLGAIYVNNFNEFGRTLQVRVRADERFRNRADGVHQLQVKNKQNQLIRLGTVLSVRDTNAPAAIERHNLCAAARITANLADGVSVAEAKSLCETLAANGLPRSFQMTWRSR
jgi:multidrug efflux pump subunit AcrB